jgi:hypothetical protein
VDCACVLMVVRCEQGISPLVRKVDVSMGILFTVGHKAS